MNGETSISNPVGSDPAGAKPPAQRWGKRNTAGVAIASSLSFDSISHAFSGTNVLTDVSIRAEPGEILCLLGPSASGKTTLLRIAAGIEVQSSGTIRIDERIVAQGRLNVPPEARGVGLVFQDYALFPHLTVLENVRFGLRGVSRQAANSDAMRMLERVGMDASASLYPQQLSGGEQQRVALARALAPRPAILLLDEPFSGLDARLRDSVREETVGLLRDMRATAIIVTHDPEEALRVGDHIALLRNGRLVQHGHGKNLYQQPADLFAARFFSELNLFSAIVENGAAATPVGAVAAPGFANGCRVDVCVRLTDLIVEQISDRRGAVVASVNGHVTSRRFVGDFEILEIFLAGIDEPVRAKIRTGELPAGVGDVRLRVGPQSALIFPQG